MSTKPTNDKYHSQISFSVAHYILCIEQLPNSYDTIQFYYTQQTMAKTGGDVGRFVYGGRHRKLHFITLPAGTIYCSDTFPSAIQTSTTHLQGVSPRNPCSPRPDQSSCRPSLPQWQSASSSHAPGGRITNEVGTISTKIFVGTRARPI